MRTLVGAGILAAVVVSLSGMRALSVYAASPGTAERAIERFEQGTRREDALMDPLLLFGPAVIPPLAQRLRTSYETPRRRYAIAALGHLGDPVAIPLLVGFIGDSKENAEVRCDAVRALSMLDEARGGIEATKLPAQLPCASGVLTEIKNGQIEKRRTVTQIILGDWVALLF